MSPEQSAGSARLDGRSDIYALGCVLYEMLGGQPPFLGPTPQAILARHAMDPVPSLRTLRPTVPRALGQVVTQALAKVPADRFPTARAFGEALATASLARARSGDDAPTAVALARASTRSHRLLIRDPASTQFGGTGSWRRVSSVSPLSRPRSRRRLFDTAWQRQSLDPASPCRRALPGECGRLVAGISARGDRRPSEREAGRHGGAEPGRVQGTAPRLAHDERRQRRRDGTPGADPRRPTGRGTADRGGDRRSRVAPHNLLPPARRREPSHPGPGDGGGLESTASHRCSIASPPGCSRSAPAWTCASFRVFRGRRSPRSVRI